jgi:hypothetical protein
MTYKHVKFEDSPIMRSLEKVAQEKGLVKPDPLTKTAAKKTDLTPSGSLLDNVLKLCAGLRDRGFEKQASELEINLLNYKQAQTLYETTPEKGEDLVHAAHPQGSHKLEGLDAENDGAVVEDILDQHAKNLQMIEKKPTGKLASISEAIEAVKVAIGAPPLVVKRAAKVSRGQEVAPSTTSNVVGDIAGVAGFAGGIAALKWLYGKLVANPSVDRQVVKAIQQALGRNLTNAESNVIIKKVVDRVGRQALEKVFSESTTKTIEDTAFENAIRSVATPVAETVATVGGGAAAEIGGAATESAVGLGAGLSAGLTGAALTAAATYLATSAIYTHDFYITELRAAGQALQNDLSYLENEQEWQNQRTNEIAFNNSLKGIDSVYEKMQGIVAQPKPEHFQALQEYADTLQYASNYAYKLSAAARAIVTGDQHMAPGTSKSDEGFFGYVGDQLQTSPIGRLMGKITPGASKAEYSDVIIHGANFVNVAQRALVDVRTAIQTILQNSRQEAVSSVDHGVGVGVDVGQLNQAYQNVQNQLNGYEAKVQAGNSSYKDRLLQYIQGARAELTSDQNMFEGGNADFKNKAVASYTNKLNTFKKVLNNFAQTWKLQ